MSARPRPTAALTLAAIAVGALVAACSSPTASAPDPSGDGGASAVASPGSAPAPAPTDRQASAPVDCGSDPAESSRERVTIVNRTSAAVRLAVSAIDCYDWGGTANPSQFSGIQLEPGSATPDTTLVVRGIPQANTQIRPWDMRVELWGGTQWLSAPVEPRPVFGAAKGSCNTAYGLTACIGVSLCPGPDYLERRTEVPLSSGFGTFTDSGRTLVVTTYCSLSDGQARIVLTEA